VSGIVNADVDNAAQIAYSKLADIDGSKLIGLANIPSGSGLIPVANIDTGTTASKIVKLDSNAKIPAVDGSLLTNILKYKILGFSRDISLANGTQAVTGAGFTPKVVVFIATVQSTALFSVGFDDLSNPNCIPSLGASAFSTGAGVSIYMFVSTGNYTTGVINSLDVDGFTISWVKTGSPTGTAYIYTLCLG